MGTDLRRENRNLAYSVVAVAGIFAALIYLPLWAVATFTLGLVFLILLAMPWRAHILGRRRLKQWRQIRDR